MSLLGGVQPGRLSSYLSGALEFGTGFGTGDDGLMQRLPVLVWPDLPAAWKLVDSAPDKRASDRVESVYRRLVELSCETPAVFRFAGDAQALFFEWYAELPSKVRNGAKKSFPSPTCSFQDSAFVFHASFAYAFSFSISDN